MAFYPCSPNPGLLKIRGLRLSGFGFDPFLVNLFIPNYIVASFRDWGVFRGFFFSANLVEASKQLSPLCDPGERRNNQNSQNEPGMSAGINEIEKRAVVS